MARRVAAFAHQLGQGLLQLLYPAVCNVCGDSLQSEQRHFCPDCKAALTSDPQATCPRCASSVGPHVNLEGGCSRCRDIALHFDQALRLGPYDGLLREQVLRLKNWTGDWLAENIGELWAEQREVQLREVSANVVIPVPLYWLRRLNRGYNQSEALAHALARRLKLPYRPRWL